MNLIKKNIHMNKIKESQIMQITLDDDFNVPDIKPDVEKIIKSSAQVCIDNYKVSGGKLLVEGEMQFTILYISSEDGRLIHCLNGRLAYNDSVNMENADVNDCIKINTTIEDLNVSLVNSRKISIRAVVTFECVAENIYDYETAVDISEEEGEDVQYINEEMTVTQIAVNKKDITRIKEDIVLPSSKQNVMEILYSDISLLGTDTRTTDAGIGIKGSMLVFVMYAGENNDVEFVEKEIIFNNTVEVAGCNSDMIDDVRITLASSEVSVKADADGEERILGLDAALSLDIKLYYEEQLSVVADLYGVKKEIHPVVEEGYYDNILLKNNSKLRLTDRIRVDDSMPALMQLCNSTVSVKLDDVSIGEDVINVEGVAMVTLLYVTNEDRMPVSSFEGMIPFTHSIEAKGINKDSVFCVRPGLDHCSVMMTDSRECEVKVAINLDTMVFGRSKKNIIVGFEEEDFLPQELEGRPMMVGYVVKDSDTLWDVAKRFTTTRDCIKAVNYLENDEIKPGDRLLIV